MCRKPGSPSDSAPTTVRLVSFVSCCYREGGGGGGGEAGCVCGERESERERESVCVREIERERERLQTDGGGFSVCYV